jgi:hypothetical protein
MRQRAVAEPDLDGVAAIYRERRDRFAAERDRLTRRSRQISSARLASFLAACAALGYALFAASGPRALSALGGAALLVLFVALVIVHERVIRALERASGLVLLNQAGLHRLARAWADLPRPSAPPLAPGSEAEALALDLNLFGEAGLFHLAATAVTPAGKQALAAWIVEPAAPAAIRERQGAVAELAPRLAERQELEVRARLMADLPPDPEPFLRWAEGAPWLRARPLRRWAPRALALAGVALVAAHAAGLTPYPLWLLVVALNLILDAIFGKHPRRLFEEISSHEREYRAYAELLRLAGQLPASDPLLARLRSTLAAGDHAAAQALRRLDRLLALADMHRAGLFHFPLEALLLWDFHVLDLLEGWQAREGRQVRRWLALLGELEALGALAGLKHDHPDWCFPSLDEATPRLVARGLGHPLLPPSRCVRNDAEVGPPGSFLLVTGSNMSGKSTLLRALGVNAVLAGAGGPACAVSLSLPALTLGTSFTIQDSLADGVSYFMAELRRLKSVVESASRARESGRLLLFLLDEILLGTNIAERQIAVREVVAHLIERGAIGAISSHDLTLASAEGLAVACRPVHFREHYREAGGKTEMSFDYLLREGIAPTTNALALLRMVGLEARSRT